MVLFTHQLFNSVITHSEKHVPSAPQTQMLEVCHTCPLAMIGFKALSAPSARLSQSPGELLPEMIS